MTGMREKDKDSRDRNMSYLISSSSSVPDMIWKIFVDKCLPGRGEGRCLSLGTRRLGGVGEGPYHQGGPLRSREKRGTPCLLASVVRLEVGRETAVLRCGECGELYTGGFCEHGAFPFGFPPKSQAWGNAFRYATSYFTEPLRVL